MAFNLEKFDQIQNQLGWKGSDRISLHVFETLNSTNEKAWEVLETDNPNPMAIVAQQQTAGRGQWGRTWNSSEGGLYLSVPLQLHSPLLASNSAHLTLCTAWGIAHGLRRYQVPVMLKWPNDLLLSGRKLGGILSETRIHQGQVTKAVVGVGINWENTVPEPGITLKSFLNNQEPEEKTRSQRSIDSLEMLGAIAIHGLLWGYQQYLIQGIDSILDSYLKLLTSKGKTVMVEGHQGTVIGVTPTGDLRIRFASPGASVEILRSPGTINLGYD